MNAIVSIKNVGKRFNAVQALDDVSFDIAAGEIHAVMGENGAGKSTLMKILSGVITDYDGDIYVNDKLLRFNGTRDAERVGISIIHQELNLVEELTVAANIFLGRESHRWYVLNQASMDRMAAELLGRLQSNISPTTLVGSLRVGDQQLVEIAKALSLNASILIMDEPTSALTESEVARLYGVIDNLRSHGVTIIYISHKMGEVFRLADRITVLRDGKFIKTTRRSEATPTQIAHAMVGREIKQVAMHSHNGEREVVLQVKNLFLAWPGHARAYRLQGIHFDLHRGEILGIAGLMGAGRTELLECLFGASDTPAVGDIRIEGKTVAFQNPYQAMQSGVALVTEDRKRLGLFGHQNVRENMTIASIADDARRGVILSHEERVRAAEQCERLHVKSDGLEASINSLSGGNQQKIILGRCLLIKPIILLLDDPTRGVDVGAKAELYRLINELADQGMSIVITSSELPELLTLSDRILVLKEGVLRGEFPRSVATEQLIMEAAT